MGDTIVSDTFAHLLQPDTLLPSQYFAALKRKGQHEPERRLAIAVLQDAVDCYQKHLRARDRKARQLFVDAEEWITSDDRTLAVLLRQRVRPAANQSGVPAPRPGRVEGTPARAPAQRAGQPQSGVVDAAGINESRCAAGAPQGRGALRPSSIFGSKGGGCTPPPFLLLALQNPIAAPSLRRSDPPQKQPVAGSIIIP